MTENEKRYFIEIKRAFHVTTMQLYLECLLPLRSIYTVEVGGYIDQETSNNVLNAFNVLSQQHITIDDIYLNLPPGQRGYRNFYVARSFRYVT